MSSVLADRPQAHSAAVAGGTLEALVRACLETPHGVGCLVCGGTLDATVRGLACRGCGSTLERGAEPRRVVRPVQR